MADTPCCLVLFGDGLLLDDKTLEAVACPALDQTAREGCSGELAFRELPGGVAESQWSLDELSQLLDLESANVDQPANGHDGRGEIRKYKSIRERFMGMSASLFSNSTAVSALGFEAGFNSVPLTVSRSGAPERDLPDAVSFAAELLFSLGLLDFPGRKATSDQTNPKTEGDSAAAKSQDLLLVHLRAEDSEHRDSAENSMRTGDSSSASTSGKNSLPKTTKRSIEWLDSLVGALRDHVKRDSKLAARLLLVVVLSYHVTALQTGSEEGTGTSPTLGGCQGKEETGMRQHLLALKPPQSYRQKDGEDVPNVREHHSALVVYNSHGLTRRDGVQSLQIENVQRSAGNLRILADKFLPEITFKIGRAPKYGA